MNRREFLTTVSAAAIASSAGDASATPVSTTPIEHDLAAPPPEIEYFTAQRMRELAPPVPVDHLKFEAVCYTFNPWHTTPLMEKTFGKGWTEYETMRMARPQFAGHYQPKRPLWGCFNEADPAWSEREIDLASSAGITAFMVDWYWHEGTMFYHEQLEQGLLKARNKDKIKFAVMWANHHWPNLYPAPEYGQEAILLEQNYSPTDMDRLIEYLIEHYFTQSNYWKIDGNVVFSTFWTNHLINHFTPSGLHKIFDGWQARAQGAGLKGIHFQAADEYNEKTPLVEAGYHSATDYLAWAGGAPGKQSPYVRQCELSIKRWHQRLEMVKGKMPYLPQCPVGWDNSPRYGKNAHVYVNRTADQFERLMRAAKYFVASEKIEPPIIFMGAWNEWTEDHYLLPDEVHGYSYLEAVKRQFKREV